MNVQIYADGANLEAMKAARASGRVQGFTTNPTLMHKAGIRDYSGFARAAVEAIPDLPISFEVFADDFEGMDRQARQLAALGDNVFVKIPITNSEGVPSLPLIKRLASDGLKINVTAMLTLDQVEAAREALNPDVPAILSVFAGRIADTGRDPEPVMLAAKDLLRDLPNFKLLWASPREILNVYQADRCGCHIITATPELLAKLGMQGQNLDLLSLETVRMFRRDALAAGFAL